MEPPELQPAASSHLVSRDDLPVSSSSHRGSASSHQPQPPPRYLPDDASHFDNAPTRRLILSAASDPTTLVFSLAVLVSTGAVLYVSLHPRFRYRWAQSWKRHTKSGRRKQQSLDKAVAAAQQATRSRSNTTTNNALAGPSASSPSPLPFPSAAPGTPTRGRSSSGVVAFSDRRLSSSNRSEASPDRSATTELSSGNMLAKITNTLSSHLFRVSSSFSQTSSATASSSSTPVPTSHDDAKAIAMGSNAEVFSSRSTVASSPSSRKVRSRKGKGVATGALSSLSGGSTASSPGVSPHRNSSCASVKASMQDEDDKNDGQPTPTSQAGVQTASDFDAQRAALAPLITIATSSPLDSPGGLSEGSPCYPFPNASDRPRPTLCDAIVQTSPTLGSSKALADEEHPTTLSPSSSSREDFNLHASFQIPSPLQQAKVASESPSEGSSSPTRGTSRSRSDSIASHASPSPSTAPTTPAISHSQLHAKSRKAGARRAAAARAAINLVPGMSPTHPSRSRHATEDTNGGGMQGDCSGSSGGAQSMPASPGVTPMGLPRVDGERLGPRAPIPPPILTPNSRRTSASSVTAFSLSSVDSTSPYLSQPLGLTMSPSPEHSRRSSGTSGSTRDPFDVKASGQTKSGHRPRLDDSYWKAAGDVGLAIDVEAAKAAHGRGGRSPPSPRSARHAPSEAYGRATNAGEPTATLDGYFPLQGTPSRVGRLSSVSPGLTPPDSSPMAPRRSHSYTNGVSPTSVSTTHHWPPHLATLAGVNASSRQSSLTFGFTPIAASPSPGYHLGPAGQHYSSQFNSPLPSPGAAQSMTQQQQQQLHQLQAQHMYNQAQAQLQHVLTLEAQVQQLGLRQQQLSQLERARQEAEQHQQHRMILLAQAMGEDSASPTSAFSMSAGTPATSGGSSATALIYPISSSSNGSDWPPAALVSQSLPPSSMLPSPAPLPSSSFGAASMDSLYASPSAATPSLGNFSFLSSASQQLAMNAMASVGQFSPQSMAPPSSAPPPQQQSSRMSSTPKPPRESNPNQRRASSGRAAGGGGGGGGGGDRSRAASSNTAALVALASVGTERIASPEWQQALKTKVKAVEMEVERSAKELEIARWRLIVLEEEQYAVENENQEALRALAQRAMRAEARLRLLEEGRNDGSSASGSGSPATRPASSSGHDEPPDTSSSRGESMDRINGRARDSKLHPLAWIDLDSISFSARPPTANQSIRPPASMDRRRNSRRASEPSTSGKQRRQSGNSRRRSQGQSPGPQDGQLRPEDGDDDEDDVLIVLDTPLKSRRLSYCGEPESLPSFPPDSGDNETGAGGEGRTGALEYIDEDEISNFDVDEYEGRSTRVYSAVETNQVGPGYIGSLPTFLKPRSQQSSRSRVPSPHDSLAESPRPGAGRASNVEGSPTLRVDELPKTTASGDELIDPAIGTSSLPSIVLESPLATPQVALEQEESHKIRPTPTPLVDVDSKPDSDERTPRVETKEQFARVLLEASSEAPIVSTMPSPIVDQGVDAS